MELENDLVQQAIFKKVMPDDKSPYKARSPKTKLDLN